MLSNILHTKITLEIVKAWKLWCQSYLSRFETCVGFFNRAVGAFSLRVCSKHTRCFTAIRSSLHYNAAPACSCTQRGERGMMKPELKIAASQDLPSYGTVNTQRASDRQHQPRPLCECVCVCIHGLGASVLDILQFSPPHPSSVINQCLVWQACIIELLYN